MSQSKACLTDNISIMHLQKKLQIIHSFCTLLDCIPCFPCKLFIGSIIDGLYTKIVTITMEFNGLRLQYSV